MEALVVGGLIGFVIGCFVMYSMLEHLKDVSPLTDEQYRQCVYEIVQLREDADKYIAELNDYMGDITKDISQTSTVLSIILKRVTNAAE